MSSKLRILIADDHAGVRDRIGALLIHAGFDVVAQPSNGREAVRMFRELGPDMAVLDISMPVLNGIDATREILQSHPGSKVILLTMHDTEAYLLVAIGAGARGYVLKTQAFLQLLEAIESVRNGDVYVSREVCEKVS